MSWCGPDPGGSKPDFALDKFVEFFCLKQCVQFVEDISICGNSNIGNVNMLYIHTRLR